MKTFVYSVLTMLGLAGGAMAATLNETDVVGGFASANQNFNPTYTQVGFGFDTINGTLTANNFDFIQLTNLDAGAQSVSLTFDLLIPSGAGFSNGGGQLRYSETYQSSPFGGTLVGNFNMAVDPFNPPGTPSTTLSFNLDNSFAGGDLFLTLLPTFSNQTIAYSTTLTGNGGSVVAPVPVPLPGLLLLAAMGLAAFATRRSAPRSAPA